jgi:hypothetical protein
LASTNKSPDEIFSDIYYPQFFELENRLIRIIPKTIYHYTNLSSFIQLVQTKKLWASRSEFLNDATEFRYGQRTAIEQIESLEKADKYRLFLEQLKRALGTVTESPFVTCFCKDGDLLSQWRGYSNHGQGICVGFRSESLQALEQVFLYNVVYDPEKQTELMFSFVKMLADCYLAVGLDLDDPQVYRKIVGHTGTMERYCALIKDPAFAEECELRLLVPDYSSDEFEIKFRVRNNLIVPFVEINLEPVWDKVVCEIIIGPGPDREVRKKNVQHFIDLMELEATVQFSGCQFR